MSAWYFDIKSKTEKDQNGESSADPQHCLAASSVRTCGSATLLGCEFGPYLSRITIWGLKCEGEEKLNYYETFTSNRASRQSPQNSRLPLKPWGHNVNVERNSYS